MAVVDITPVTDRLDNEDIVVPIPSDERSVVARSEFVVRIPGKRVKSMFRPILGLGEFLQDALTGFLLELCEMLVCLRRELPHPTARLTTRA